MEVDFVSNAYGVNASASTRPIDSTSDEYGGDTAIPGHLAPKVARDLNFGGRSAQKKQKLSQREGEVLDLLSEGDRYKEIGNKLNIAPETVRAHVKSICRKMRVRRRVEAIAKHLKDVS